MLPNAFLCIKPSESELIGTELRWDSGEYGLSGKFRKILLMYQMQYGIDTAYPVKVYGNSTRLFIRCKLKPNSRYEFKQVVGTKKISEFVSTK
ncbi:hypothetical protein AVEN_181115-1 [Araneus ventricosus]|uniref:Uncharacterized protein n=1 Tax=Araneus ventricosus TaxID=182803 RepID=A0A4Y2FI19_ARAVE|nr:hypothetical protein AVEN_181115-1 [Araneus ventricosus]